MKVQQYIYIKNLFFSCRGIKIYVATLVLLFFLFSCGTHKQTKKEPNLVQKEAVSVQDYPYIEKFHEGLRFKAKGEIDNAIKSLNYCLTVRQDDDAVYYALSELYEQKKDFEKSVQNIETAVKLAPDNTWYTQEMAYLFFEQNKFDKALESFEKLIKKEPGNVDWLYAYAECLVRLGKNKEAIKALDKTEEQVGRHPEFAIQKFNLYLRMKQPNKALQEIENARKEFPDEPQLIGTLVDYYFQTHQEAKAISMLEQLTITDPDNGRAHLGLADIYRQQGKKKEYLSELKKGFACDDVAIDAKMKILIDMYDAPSKLPQEAYELVDILVKKYPTDAKAYSIQGDYLLKAEKTTEALNSYKQAVKYDKTKFTIWNQVLLMEYQAGNYSDLYLDSRECLTLFPSIPSVYLLNGVAANQLRKYDDAESTLQAGKEMVVNDKIVESEFYSQLGEAYFGLKKYTEAKTNYEPALTIDPSSTANMNNFAYQLGLAKIDLDRAEELIKTANLISPNQAHFLDTYGWILFQKGEYPKAKEQFEKAYNLNSKDRVITEHMGDIAFKSGQIDKAVEFWQKAKALGSTNKNLDKKIEKKDYYDPIY